MILSIVKLYFKTPFHISNVRSDYNISEKIFHSDSLYSAIINSWNVLGIEDAIPKNENDTLRFSTSSLFPFTKDIDNKTDVYFLAKPYGFLNDKQLGEESKPDAKANKKAEYWDIDFYSNYLNNNKLADYKDSVQGKFLSRKRINEDFMLNDVSQRVQIPKCGEIDEKTGKAKETTPYYIDRIYFESGSGLYAIMQFDDEKTKQNVLAALRYLQDEGLGTDRHVGNGLFVMEEAELNINMPEASEYYTNISLFCPEDKETFVSMTDNNKARFDIIKRGGWITSEPYQTYRKRYINMFKEGSLFYMGKNVKGIEVKGKTVNLAPQKTPVKIEHPIFRVGKSIFLPVKI